MIPATLGATDSPSILGFGPSEAQPIRNFHGY
jgi:hypothetical protein